MARNGGGLSVPFGDNAAAACGKVLAGSCLAGPEIVTEGQSSVSGPRFTV